MRGFTISIGVLACLICASITCFATTYYVNPSDTIQDAIDSATHGDTVIVAQGTYYENIFFNGKNIVLTSTDPEDSAVVAATIIDANDSGSVVRFDNSETAECVLTGFTVRNGSGTRVRGMYDWEYHGGGIFGSSSATIQNNNRVHSKKG
jgi:hypothetical protein